MVNIMWPKYSCKKSWIHVFFCHDLKMRGGGRQLCMGQPYPSVRQKIDIWTLMLYYPELCD